jgi:predicted nucleic acid-binding protein
MRSYVDIKLMPAQTVALIDANIFIYHLSGHSAESTALLQRIHSGEIEGYITTVVIAEVLHRRMIGEAIAKRLVSPTQAMKRLKANPRLVSMLTNYIADVETLLQLPLKIIEVQPADISFSHALRQSHGLFVNDSINLACALRHGITDVATHDADFARVLAIKAWEPTDI